MDVTDSSRSDRADKEIQIKYILRETAALLYYRVFNAPADDIGVDL